MPSSDLWDAQDAAFELLQTGTYPTKTSVTYGAPVGDYLDAVWINGSVPDWSAEWAVSGLAAKDEMFGIQVCAMSIRLGTDYTKPRAAVRVLSDTIEALFAGDHTLGNAVMLASSLRWTLDDALIGDKSRGVKWTGTIVCRAWAT